MAKDLVDPNLPLPEMKHQFCNCFIVYAFLHDNYKDKNSQDH